MKNQKDHLEGLRHRAATIVAVLLMVAVASPIAQADVSLVACQARLQASQTPDIPARFAEIQKQYLTQIRAAGTDRRAQSAAMIARRRALLELTQEAAKGDAEKLTAEDHAVLAEVATSLRNSADAIVHSRAAIAAGSKSSSPHVTLVRTLASGGKVDEAEEAFSAARKAFPDRGDVAALHYVLYMANSRAKKTAAAAQHVADYVESRISVSSSQPTAAPLFARYLGQMVDAYNNPELRAKGIERLDRQIATTAEISKEKPSGALAGIAAELIGAKTRLLLSSDAAAAEKLLTEELVDSEAKLDAAALQAEENDDARAEAARAAIRAVVLKRIRMEISEEQGADNAEKATEEFRAFAAEQLKRYPEASELGDVFTRSQVDLIGRLARTHQIEKAEKSLVAARETIKSLEGPAASRIANQLNSVTALIDRERPRAALLGKDFIAPEPDAWVGGKALAAEDLQGKVVLIDFWAVWCGPCIATFPELRRWHDKYHKDGLVLIGSTRYYQYGWDPAAGRPSREVGISPEKEQEAIALFAKHHELRHVMAVGKSDSNFAKQYAVTGIPQVVLVDRHGKVRMIRVGSGSQNAHDLEAMIEKLLAEK